MSAMESPGHTVRINPAPKKPKVEAIPERESFPPGPPFLAQPARAANYNTKQIPRSTTR